MQRFASLAAVLLLAASATVQALQPQPRIIGGITADEGEWPWTVAIIEAGKLPMDGQFCAGSLILPDWVLTAAHCVHDDAGNPVDAAEIEVISGFTTLSDATRDDALPVTAIFPHTGFNLGTFDNDIALLQLAGKTGQENLAVATSRPAAGSPVTVVGWGVTNPKDTLGITAQDTLNEVEVEVIATTACNARDFYNGQVTENMLCAGVPEGGKDACFGDSGGPLMMEHDGQWRQVGISSWGIGCAEPNHPGVYTRLSRYDCWIASVTGESQFCAADGGGGSVGPLGLGALLLLFGFGLLPRKRKDDAD